MLAGLLAAGAGAAWAGWAVRGRSANVFGPSFWRGPRDRRVLALTFDDGPSESTPGLLELLAQQRVRATFFFSGAAAERLPDIARAVAAAGHEIASHGYSHAPLYLRSPGFVYGEMARGQEAIARVTGVTPRLYRPAYGCRWFGLESARRKLGLTTVLWTVLGLDWKRPAARVASRLVARATPGAILCLHDGRATARHPDIRDTVEALRIAVPELQRAGYGFETAGELLAPLIVR